MNVAELSALSVTASNFMDNVFPRSHSSQVDPCF